MTAKPATPTCLPAAEALLDLAQATRPDIDRAQLAGAITNATSRGRTWPQVMLLVVRCLALGEGPADVHAAVQAVPPGGVPRP